MLGYWALQDHAEHVLVVVHGHEPRFAFFLRERAWPRLLLERDADLLRSVRLAANVDADFLVLADADRHELAERVLRRAGAYARGDLCQDSVAHGAAVDQAVVHHCCHFVAELTKRVTRSRVAGR